MDDQLISPFPLLPGVKSLLYNRTRKSIARCLHYEIMILPLLLRSFLKRFFNFEFFGPYINILCTINLEIVLSPLSHKCVASFFSNLRF